MKIFSYPVLLILLFLCLALPLPSSAAQNGVRGPEVVYPLFYGANPRSGPCGGRRERPYLPRLEGDTRVEVEEIKDGVLIRLTSEDEKTMKGLRLMGRMMKLISEMRELEGAAR